ncbi:hypothetical protein LUZ62_051008 [Rhynchospora pubera]|uniref:Uncharacterized protein n=1 Tax=Rhynchospora pubera TaxID=906938 RepID=A0AAV8G2Q5_9POAL|nr:hypothetical protein LUZ62_051008 [Rhynchospora pubera]
MSFGTLLFILFLHHASSHKTEYTTLIDQIVRDAAMRSYHSQKHQKTAVHYSLLLPPYLSGISAETVRYRAGSLRQYGASLGEFSLPPGIITQPHVKHIIVIRENMGRFSSMYEQYISTNTRLRFISPVLGLLFYNATTFHSSSSAGLHILVTKTPIIVNFSTVVESQLVQKAQCVVFQLDGNISVTNQPWDNVCITWQQGHIALMEEEASGGDDQNSTEVSRWKLVAVWIMVGTAGVVLIGLLVVALVSVRRKRNLLAEMERRAYEEEALRVSMVGHVRAPTATGARTKPSLEDEFAHEL